MVHFGRFLKWLLAWFWWKVRPKIKGHIVSSVLFKIILSEKSLSVNMSITFHQVPVTVPQRIIEIENFARQSSQTHYKGNKNTSIVMLLLLSRPLQCRRCSYQNHCIYGQGEPELLKHQKKANLDLNLTKLVTRWPKLCQEAWTTKQDHYSTQLETQIVLWK